MIIAQDCDIVSTAPMNIAILRTFVSRFIAVLWLLLAFACSSTAFAQTLPLPRNISAQMDVETQLPAPGDSVTLAIVMKPKDGWHDYWLNPADAGTPLELEWNLPEGVTAGPIRAPVPTTLMVGGFMNYVYKRDHAFLVDLKISADIAPGTRLPIAVDARWSACSDRVCVPEGDSFTTALTTGNGNIAEPDRLRFDKYRQQIPPQIDSNGIFERRGETLKLAIPYPASAPLSEVYFFPVDPKLINHSGPQAARRKGDYVIFEIAVSGQMEQVPGSVQGLLKTAPGEGVMAQLLPGEVPSGGQAIATSSDDNAAGGASALPAPDEQKGSIPPLWLTFFGAILGGLLLNLMPCVFPILGLKAISLAKMGGGQQAARRDALAYSAGVILSCLTLGLLLLLLRAAGEQVGWAFQLQQPVVVLTLLLLLSAITANLAGMFEVGLPMQAGTHDGGLGSFGTGILAAVIATPCTGPFMAAALGAALLLPVPQALLLFTALGFGLALPYLLIAYIPALRSLMPKQGPWMETFRRVMAIPMLLTALALGWLLWRLSGIGGLLIGLAALLLLLGALFATGRLQRRGKAATLPALAAMGIAAMAAVLLPANPIKRDAEAQAAQSILPTENFSEPRLAEYRSSGRGVFVYFTADWCVTCKVNERVAIEREATAQAFAKNNIAVLRGDFTQRDPDIAGILVKYGSAGVPLYLWFAPGEEVQILPQILTPDMLTELE